jgi:hypothetical protein
VQHGGEWGRWRDGVVGSGVWARHSGERRCGTMGSGVLARRGGERQRGAVGSGDGGVWRDSMGSRQQSAGAGEVGFSSEAGDFIHST